VVVREYRGESHTRGKDVHLIEICLPLARVQLCIQADLGILPRIEISVREMCGERGYPND
jgi:hypothetical protein